MHEKLAAALDAADRQGADRDEPEGARFIQISDTLARQIAETLRSR
ncbi:MAG: hypothetical protein ACQGVC_18215 [Myxococcota bacterium]